MEAAGKRYVFYNSRSAHFKIWNLSDLHYLAKGCAETDLKRDLEAIRNDPFSLWLGGGDYADFIGHHDKRFDPDAVASWVPLKALGDLGKFGMEKVRDLFMPIKDKCLGLLIGNHELKYELATQQESLHHWLVQELNVPYLGYCCLMDVVFCRTNTGKTPTLSLTPPTHGKYASQSLRVFAHHGAGYAATPGGKLNRLIGFMNAFQADLYFCGHVHDKTARKEPTLGADSACTNIVQFERLGLISGSYLKTYTVGSISYGEQKGYRPVSLGAAVAEFYPETRELRAAI